MAETRTTRLANVVILASAGFFALSLLFAFQLERKPPGWGGTLYFVYLPDVFFLRFRGQKEMFSRAPVLAMVNALGIPVIDVHRVFLAQPNPDGFRYDYESHFTEAGYELTAAAILNGLKPAPPDGADGG